MNQVSQGCPNRINLGKPGKLYQIKICSTPLLICGWTWDRTGTPFRAQGFKSSQYGIYAKAS